MQRFIFLMLCFSYHKHTLLLNILLDLSTWLSSLGDFLVLFTIFFASLEFPVTTNLVWPMTMQEIAKRALQAYRYERLYGWLRIASKLQTFTKRRGQTQSRCDFLLFSCKDVNFVPRRLDVTAWVYIINHGISLNKVTQTSRISIRRLVARAKKIFADYLNLCKKKKK